MIFNGCLGNRQSQSRTASFITARFVQAHKWAQSVTFFVVWDTGTVIFDNNFYLICGIVFRDANRFFLHIWLRFQ